MPPLGSASKSKHKAKEARPSRSRNTTPSSVISAAAVPAVPLTTPFLQLDTSKLLVAPHPSYADILDRLETKPTSLEPKLLQDINEQLKQLSDAAEKRVEVCENAIRVIHAQLKDLESEQKERERERQAEHHRKAQAKKDESQKNVKAKKRKDREPVDVEIKREDTPGPTDSPSPSKKIKQSPGTSSLSDVADSPKPAPESRASPARSDESMEENRIVHRPPPVPAHGFFPDPLAPDPIIYHIRNVTPDMTEEERKAIYSVTSYPTNDLSDQIAGGGIIPDKDFSNAKPVNQIAFNTFQTFVEPYTRPLAEEDMAFLRERGDRVTPFLPVPRGKKHWTEVWAEEDGSMITDAMDRLSTTHPRGSVEQIEDGNETTDSVSSGPLASRLMSLLKFEHRSPLTDLTGNEINAFTDGNDTMDLDGLATGNEGGERPLASATSVADVPGSKSSHRLDYVQSDERIKAELRYLGLLGQDENPDYDAHNDDDISERLRLLQAELRRVMIVNGARKARLLDLAKERLAYQEYSTIHDDLDSQVQQAYLKRTRTLGKTKKGPGGNKPKPGLASAIGFGLSRARDIGDNARMLMDRRKRWQNCIGPVFKDMKHGIPGKDETIWESKLMEGYEKAELEAMEEEGE